MDRDYSPREVLQIVRRRRWAVLASLFAGLGLASAASIALPKAYKCSTRIEVTANRNMPGSEYAAKVDAVREQLLSLSTMSRVVDELGIAAAPDDDRSPADPAERRAGAAKDLLLATRVEKEEPGEGTYYIRIEHVSPDPVRCHRVLDCLVSGYKKELYERPRLQQQDVVANAAKSVESATERVQAAQDQLGAFEQENAELLGPLDQQLQTVQKEISTIEEKDIVRATEDLRQAEDVLRTEPQFHVQIVKRVDSVRMAGYDTELNRLTIKLNDLTVTKRYTDEHPEVKSVKQSIAQIQAEKKALEASAQPEEVRTDNQLYIEYMKRKAEAQSSLFVARQSLASARRNEKALQDLLKQVPPVKNQRDRLVGDLTSAKTSLDDRTRELRKAEDKLESINNERQLNFSIVDAPVPPRGPAGPAPAVFALAGLVVGGAAGLGVAWLIEVQDTSFREVDAVAEFLGVPSLGAIHQIETPPESAARRAATMRRAAAVAALGLAAAALAGYSVWIGLRHLPAAQAQEQEGGDR